MEILEESSERGAHASTRLEYAEGFGWPDPAGYKPTSCKCEADD
jgi:hypothetical protein